MSYFSSSLKCVMDARGWSQTDASRALGISTSTISLYLSGERQPAIDQLRRILAGLNDAERADILIGVMRDTVPGEEYRPLVHITTSAGIAGLRERVADHWRSIPLPKEVKNAITRLATAAVQDDDISAFLIAAAAAMTAAK